MRSHKSVNKKQEESIMAKRGGFPGGMPGNMNNLMKQAQKMQKQMAETTKALEEKSYEACGCLTTLYSGSQIGHIYRLVPVLINLGIRFLTGFSFYQATVQRRCGQR